MKEIKLIQNDDGTITIESMDAEGNPVQTVADSAASAIEQLQADFMGKAEAMASDEMAERETGVAGSPEVPEVENIPMSASKGKRLEDNLPIIEEKKRGANAKKKADWSDYGAM